MVETGDVGSQRKWWRLGAQRQAGNGKARVASSFAWVLSMVVYYVLRCWSLERRMLVPPNLGGHAMQFPKTSTSRGVGTVFKTGCSQIGSSDLQVYWYSTSFKVSVLGGGAQVGVGGSAGGSGGRSGNARVHGAGAGADGAGTDGGADLPNSRSSSSRNF